MFGTLAGALAARHVDFDRNQYTATVEGVIEGEGKTIHITQIIVHYRLAVPQGQRGLAQRALEVHPQGCPAHESVKGAIDIRWDADIVEI